MELTYIRIRLLTVVMDILEVLTGEELVTIVTRAEDGSLTPWTFAPDAELLEDQLNSWMDKTPWNSPKSL